MQDIAEWRKRIDEIDKKLLALLNERAHCAVEIGNIKKRAGIEVYDPERENEILNHIRSVNEGPLSNDSIQRLFEYLIRETRQLECD
jgi:chorismate mutase-like protein